MKVKTYLEQLEILDTKINQKQLQLDDLKWRATGIGGSRCGERVQTSRTGDALSNAVTKYIVLEQEINNDIDYFVDKKNIIINQIQSLDNVKHIKLLFARYVQYKGLEDISVEMNYTYQYTKELHRYALREFERTYHNLL